LVLSSLSLNYLIAGRPWVNIAFLALKLLFSGLMPFFNIHLSMPLNIIAVVVFSYKEEKQFQRLWEEFKYY